MCDYKTLLNVEKVRVPFSLSLFPPSPFASPLPPEIPLFNWLLPEAVYLFKNFNHLRRNLLFPKGLNYQ